MMRKFFIFYLFILAFWSEGTGNGFSLSFKEVDSSESDVIIQKSQKPSSSSIVLNDIDFIFIGDEKNAPDPITHLGAVNDPYLISKYEVTVAQYARFLNAVASKEDPHHLYHQELALDNKVASLERTEGEEGYSYLVINDGGDLPVTYISLYDAMRYCNWLENHRPTTKEGDDIIAASTEMGAYVFTVNEEGKEVVTINDNATYRLPNPDQWMKAAYYKKGSNNKVLGNHSYSLYPTSYDNAPHSSLLNGGDERNKANYKNYFKSPSDIVLTPVNASPQTMTFYGAADMGGNVAEWTFSSFEESEKEGAIILAKAYGGSWRSEYSLFYNNELMRTFSPPLRDPFHGDNTTGFRIVANEIPPSSFETPSAESIEANKNDEIVKGKKLQQLQDGIQWGLFGIDIVSSGMLFLEVVAGLVMIEISLPFVVITTLLSFVMDYITQGGFMADGGFFLLEFLLKLFK